MPTLLFVNACVRGKDSRTLSLCEKVLERIHEENRKDMAVKFEERMGKVREEFRRN